MTPTDLDAVIQGLEHTYRATLEESTTCPPDVRARAELLLGQLAIRMSRFLLAGKMVPDVLQARLAAGLDPASIAEVDAELAEPIAALQRMHPGEMPQKDRDTLRVALGTTWDESIGIADNVLEAFVGPKRVETRGFPELTVADLAAFAPAPEDPTAAMWSRVLDELVGQRGRVHTEPLPWNAFHMDDIMGQLVVVDLGPWLWNERYRYLLNESIVIGTEGVLMLDSGDESTFGAMERRAIAHLANEATRRAARHAVVARVSDDIMGPTGDGEVDFATQIEGAWLWIEGHALFQWADGHVTTLAGHEADPG